MFAGVFCEYCKKEKYLQLLILKMVFTENKRFKVVPSFIFSDYLSWLRMPRQRLTIWTLVHFHPLEKLRGINVCKGCLVVALQADLISRF